MPRTANDRWIDYVCDGDRCTDNHGLARHISHRIAGSTGTLIELELLHSGWRRNPRGDYFCPICAAGRADLVGAG